VLTVAGLSKAYRNKMVFNNINLEFTKGIYVLLAPNGEGKTTLIKLLATLLFPDSGKIEYNGVSIYKLDEEYRGRIGYLPQEFNAYPSFSAISYMKYIAECKGIKKKEAEKRIPALFSLVSLDEVCKNRVGTFSVGMRKRLGIAQALLNDPEILIFDEPTAGLDPKESIRIRNYLTDISAEKTIIISTHILSDTEGIGGQIIMLKNGGVLYHGGQEALCGVLKGKVFQLCCSPEELPEGAFVTVQRRENEGVLFRYILEERHGGHPAAEACEPSLEDLFIFSYRDDPLKSQATNECQRSIKAAQD